MEGKCRRSARSASSAQNAFHEVDRYSSPEKTYAILTAIHHFSEEAFEALSAGVPVDEITDIDAAPRLNRIGVQDEWETYVEELNSAVTDQLREKY